ncbi:hypothetical protein BC829DRAFT_400588, partial [Chytridium lagenaria]
SRHLHPLDTHLIIGSLDATRPTILLGGPSNPTLRSPSLIFSIITTFLCDRLEKECGAPMETVRVCRLAMRQPLFMENARGGVLKGERRRACGRAVDEFNRALGVMTRFEEEVMVGHEEL